jgi:hypothetical protein
VQEGGVVGAYAEGILDGGAVPIPVLYHGRLIRRGHVQVRQDERVAANRGGPGEIGNRQGALARCRAWRRQERGSAETCSRCQPGPADQQRGVRRHQSGR